MPQVGRLQIDPMVSFLNQPLGIEPEPEPDPECSSSI
jgi:hypothetical protein